MASNTGSDRITMLTLQDKDGHYCLIPWQIVQQARVPAEHVPAFEQLLAEQSEVGGFIVPGLGGGLPAVPLADLGTEQQLRMQMYMDRYTKMVQMMSDILKKQSDMAHTIAGNMK